MALLNSLPTGVISQIVHRLTPRLHIDFIDELPAEITLKICDYLDPDSLINLARCRRKWYDIVIDRKLWESKYYLEGWKANLAEIEAQETERNLDTAESSPFEHVLCEDGLAHKKRITTPHPGDDDVEMGGTSTSRENADVEMGQSLFGNPSAIPKAGISQRMGDLSMRGSGSGSTNSIKTDKGKGREISPESHPQGSSRLPKSELWVKDHGNPPRWRVNWKYLYTARRRLESNWEMGKFTNFQLPHPDHPEEGHGECIYSLQYNSKYLVSGSRDRTLKIWDMKTRRCLRTLAKHNGSVLCLQFDSDPDEDIIVSGSSDSDVIIWRFSTGEVIQTLSDAHTESVLNVKFDKRILVTCSKDKLIKVFNRKPLRYGELGYKEVEPASRTIRNYGYSLNMTPDDYPVLPPWTMISVLEGHTAAVNAVQIQGREVVSASGDRHIKLWDWPTQFCTRTVIGHNKGIACVQYDGRRIVSGSSDNEVKVFDRETGVEVASLRAHSQLVRTVQAGFGDLPYSVEEDLAAAKRVDAEYFKAIEEGRIDPDDDQRPRRGRRHGNAGSSRPEDICAYGAKLPPGGGGGKYGRIVSGSYDTTIIIWRRDKEGVWKAQHHLRQEEAAVAAIRLAHQQSAAIAAATTSATAQLHMVSHVPFPPPSSRAVPSTSAVNATPRVQSASAPPASSTGPTRPPINPMDISHITHVDPPIYAPLTRETVAIRQIIDSTVPAGPLALQHAILSRPEILEQRSYLEEAIFRQTNPVAVNRLRQVLQAAYLREQYEQARQRREATDATGDQGSSNAVGNGQHQLPGNSINNRPPLAGPHQPTPEQMAAITAAQQAHQANVQTAYGLNVHQVAHPGHHAPPPHNQAPAARQQAPAEPEATNPARVFKLQYDARRIICCSQTSTIVGWDFCNGDPELQEASHFFAPVE